MVSFEIRMRSRSASWVPMPGKTWKAGCFQIHNILSYEREMDSSYKKIENPIFREAPFFVAARTNRLGRVVLYLAPDMPDLRHRVASDLYSYGAIKDLNAVKTITPEMA